mmetsp:Transcript_21475/g.72266  ORF Transcript_21475/g.72266 Transcript_21475/m.72266 type:complete len:290 (+) Transcript_21475:104-973(+)
MSRVMPPVRMKVLSIALFIELAHEPAREQAQAALKRGHHIARDGLRAVLARARKRPRARALVGLGEPLPQGLQVRGVPRPRRPDDGHDPAHASGLRRHSRPPPRQRARQDVAHRAERCVHGGRVHLRGGGGVGREGYAHGLAVRGHGHKGRQGAGQLAGGHEPVTTHPRLARAAPRAAAQVAAQGRRLGPAPWRLELVHALGDAVGEHLHQRPAPPPAGLQLLLVRAPRPDQSRAQSAGEAEGAHVAEVQHGHHNHLQDVLHLESHAHESTGVLRIGIPSGARDSHHPV